MSREIKFRLRIEQHGTGEVFTFIRSLEEIEDKGFYLIKGSEDVILSRDQYTGLKDKNGKEGYFDSDIWEIKNYGYRVKKFGGYQRKECDLRFILKQGLLRIEFTLINPPKDLDHITLATIFNLKSESGKRAFVDRDRQNLEIIGNIYEHCEHGKGLNDYCEPCGRVNGG